MYIIIIIVLNTVEWEEIARRRLLIFFAVSRTYLGQVFQILIHVHDGRYIFSVRLRKVYYNS